MRYRYTANTKLAGPLTDPSKLRYQAVFLMGPAGSGKSFVVENKYLKYMPGAGHSGVKERKILKKMLERTLEEAERGLSNITFESIIDNLQKSGFDIELVDASKARIPFRLYTYDQNGQHIVPRDEWEEKLPSNIFREVKELEEVVFNSPIHELPSYWRQVNPDVYKEELPGFDPADPSYVHEMSSTMSKSYLRAIFETGDPVVVDGTGRNLGKMQRLLSEAEEAGYQTSLVYVAVPLTVSLLRNAARSRSVDPKIVLGMWKAISKNYVQLRREADKSRVIINTNPSYDSKLWANQGPEIDEFMLQSTGLTLHDFVVSNAPGEKDTLRKLGIT